MNKTLIIKVDLPDSFAEIIEGAEVCVPSLKFIIEDSEIDVAQLLIPAHKIFYHLEDRKKVGSPLSKSFAEVMPVNRAERIFRRIQKWFRQDAQKLH